MKSGMCLFRLVLVAMCGVLANHSTVLALDKGGESQYTIKEVMVTAYKEKLANRVIKGEATTEEKQRLLTLYEALAATAPPRGTQASWEKKTVALVEAAQAAVEGQENAPKLLKKTMECGACHSNHK